MDAPELSYRVPDRVVRRGLAFAAAFALAGGWLACAGVAHVLTGEAKAGDSLLGGEYSSLACAAFGLFFLLVAAAAWKRAAPGLRRIPLLTLDAEGATVGDGDRVPRKRFLWAEGVALRVDGSWLVFATKAYAARLAQHELDAPLEQVLGQASRLRDAAAGPRG
jgi:hypothetical protein